MNRFMLVLLAASVASAFGQSGPLEPESTEIVVPDLILRVEELRIERIVAPLPSEGDLALGRVSVPLPGPGELRVDDRALTLQLPGTQAASAGANSVFSTGRLGAGTANHVVGELTLFKLGADPRFRIGFGYEGIDGFQWRRPGTGFFRTENQVEGSIALSSEQFEFESSGSFTERTEGLQGNSDFFSVGVRRTRADAELTYRPDPLVSIVSIVDGSISTRIQSTSDTDEVPREREHSLQPSFEGRVTVGAVDIVLGTAYFLRYFSAPSLPVAQSIDALAGIDLEFRRVSASVRGGISWNFETQLRYPWNAQLNLLLADSVDATASGGYRIERLRYNDLWADHPLLAVESTAGGQLRDNGVWHGGLDVRWSGPSGLAINTAAEYTYSEARIDVREFTDQSVYSFVQRALSNLRVSARAGWRVTPRFSVQTGYSGWFIDTVAGMPTATFDAAASITDGLGRFSLATDARVSLYPEPTLPWITVTGSYVMTDGVDLDLELTDVFAPLLGETGRPAFGPFVSPESPFIEPGFRGTLVMRISL